MWRHRRFRCPAHRLLMMMKLLETNILKAEKQPLRWLLIFCVLMVVVAVGCGFINAQSQKKKTQAPKEVYTRPKPTRPIHPEIPSANRYRQDKVFLEQADSLYRRATDAEEHQIVKGNVKFRQGGMWMFCDSAYYFPELNSLDAFGHVKMQQGDTLFVYADKLFYNGDERRARLRCGPSERSVRLINRDVTLTTDSLDYDLAMELGWYAYGGRIDDKVNVLTSIYGQYSPSTKEAEFYHDVVLVNNRDGYKMLTDTLLYNTATHIARIVSPTKIVGENDTILTSSGTYNTAIDEAILNSRSTILHRDSNNNVVTLEGDSIIYDKATRISRAYSFGDSKKIPAPVVLTDTANKTTLIGGFAMYNDSTKEALSTDYPLLMEYSRPDTLFLRADTILTFLESRMVFPPAVLDSVRHLNDSLKVWSDSVRKECLRLDSINQSRLDSLGGVRMDSVQLVGADSIENSSKRLEGAGGGAEEHSLPPGREGDPNSPHPEGAPAPERERKPWEYDEVKPDSLLMIPKDFHVAQAFHRARFFNQDLQGVADSMVFIEFDSILYLYVKPVVWSGERQVTGNEIMVHFNDSTPDWALLPDYGMMSEWVEEDFYNQLAGDEMKAWFENKDLRRLDVDGSVQTIFLPQDNDSTYSRLVNANGGHLTMDVADRKLEHLKLWPDVDGSVTPLFMVKNNQKYLPGFEWLDAIRPQRAWYGDRLHWADDLGEISDELEEYFLRKDETQKGQRRYVKRAMPTIAPADSAALAPAELSAPPTNGEEETVTVFTEEGEIIEQQPESSNQETPEMPAAKEPAITQEKKGGAQ